MGKPSGGVVGIWLDDHKLVEACKKVRLSGYKTFDAITPFPVHGIEEAIGIKRSIIPWVTFFAGLLGLTAGLSLTYWTSAISWALNIGGKPFFSGPAFMPIIFAMFALVGLPKIDPPIIDKDLTSHKFAIFINDREPGYDAAKAEQLLKSLGAVEVRRIAEY
jgi:Protein of unknown function (DUF3341)